MSLGRKIFLSYLIVIILALAVLAAATAFITPIEFTRQMPMMKNGMMGRGGMMTTLLADIEIQVQQAVNRAVLLAALVAVGAATIASWFVSTRIVSPLEQMATVSQRIADGHYDERVSYTASDELGELSRSFNQMAAALEETETMRRQLLGDVSHELKTPLASIKGYMEGLQDGIIPASAETYQLIYQEANRLQHLVQGLNDLSRAEADQLNLEKTACDIAAILRNTAAFLHPQFDEKGVTLQLQLPEKPLTLQADYERLRQVFINLLGNALQYTPESGRVTVSAQFQDEHVHITVADTGIGLAPDDAERIFQRFYRVDKSRARASGGSGIGLTIGRYIVEAHGGRLWAESPGLNQGATFHLTLPHMGLKSS